MGYVTLTFLLLINGELSFVDGGDFYENEMSTCKSTARLAIELSKEKKMEGSFTGFSCQYIYYVDPHLSGDKENAE